MARPCKAVAGKRHKTERHIGCNRAGGIQRFLHRGEFLNRRHSAVGSDHIGQFAGLPLPEYRRRQRIDYAGSADDKKPDQCHDAEQVVQIQPLQAYRLLAPHGAERKLAHERAVQHDARYQRRDQQQPHQTQKQRPPQACEHIDMQPQHNIHDALVQRILIQIIAGAGVERIKCRGFRRRHVFGHAHKPEIGLVRVGHDKLHGIAGPPRFGGRDDRIQVGPLRRFRQVRRGYAIAERAIDFIGENQRQPGQAQQQHERGADQARPFVDQIPWLD